MNDEGHSATERQALCNATLVGGGTVGDAERGRQPAPH
jgi:hypothetical protein